jgi:hypothetical protein
VLDCWIRFFAAVAELPCAARSDTDMDNIRGRMKRILFALLALLMPSAAHAACPNPIKDASGATQNFNTTVDGSGNCSGIQAIPGIALTTGTSWAAGTASGTTQPIMTSQGAPAVLVQLKEGAGITAGAVVFDGTYDGTFTDGSGGRPIQIPTAQVLNPQTFGNLPNPYILDTVATNKPFLILTGGFQAIRLRVSTTTAGGTVQPIIALLAHNPAIGAILNPLAAGSAVIGKVGVDQSTPGVTNGVSLAYDPCSFISKTNLPISTNRGNTLLVSGVSSKKVYICSLSLLASAATAVSLSEGTGSACNTASQAAVMGVAANGTLANGMSLPANGGLILGSGVSTVANTATAANNLCLVQSGTAGLAGNATYVIN